MHTVREDTEESTKEEQPELFIDNITIENDGESNEQAYVEVKISSPSQKVKFKLDTWAQANTIPTDMLQAKFNNIALKPATHKLTKYRGGTLSVRGTCQLKCRYEKSSMLLDFHVIDTDAPPVLAMKTCRDLNLVKIAMAVSEEHETSSVKPSENMTNTSERYWTSSWREE